MNNVVVKLIVVGVIFLLPAFLLIRDISDKKYSNQTKTYRIITIILFVLYIVLLIPSIIFLYDDHKNQAVNKKQMNDLTTRNKELSSKVDELSEGQKTLIINNTKLLYINTKLVADVNKYQIDLKEKEEQIKELQHKTKLAGQGITLKYQFNGMRRETSGAVTNLIEDTPQYIKFMKMHELLQQKNYEALIDICESETKKTPEWVTPYYYLGIAYGKTGNKAKAIEYFEYVIKNAPHDSDYARAADYLKQLKGNDLDRN